ncbi:hypothetical protein GOP47_0014161 [Adiantum capillus-veneris]|uniref:RING-type domain-containing protein n=1 Tax=Adiantum capillus-veneris TaxID=13818 RepID=A0A9D4UPW5_ADICA|nr:hypothetical protein GOP47_0014161 [Adiantum capillus-veneris]
MQASVPEKDGPQQRAVPSLMMQMPDCPVCWDLFDDGARMPRILRCGHTVCESCLEYLPVDSRLGQRCLLCPECRSPCLWRGVRELPKNFILLRAMNKSAGTAGSHLQESYLSSIFIDLPFLLSLLHFLSTETRWLQRVVKRKLWDVTRLFCLAALLLMLVPLSLAHMFLAWWVACLGFLLLIWFTAGGFGLGAFILCLWVSYNIVYIFLRLNRSFHRKLTDVG